MGKYQLPFTLRRFFPIRLQAQLQFKQLMPGAATDVSPIN
jgi:hypothetical protein